MRRRSLPKLALIYAVLLHAVALLPSQPAQAQFAGCCRIAGKVISSTTGAPLAQARVTITDVQAGGPTASVVTGSDGAFLFPNLAPGKYSLSAARRGYIEAFFNQHDNYSTAIVTGGDSDSEHLVFRLTPQAILTGHVLDEFGEPVRGANVSLHRQDRGEGKGLIRIMATSFTDDRGIYEFADLAAGDYFVSVNAKPWFALSPSSPQSGSPQAAPVNPDRTFDVAYPTTYYPDTTDSDEATAIPLRGGEHLTADVHLTPVPALRLVIRLSSSDAEFVMPQLLRKSFDSMENITNSLIQMSANGQLGGNWMDFIRPGQGQVELVGIPAGKYTVFVPDSSSNQGEGSLADVDLSRDGQELNPASSDPVSSLNFKVSVAGSKSIPDQLILVLRTDDHKITVASRVNPDGSSDFVHIPPGKFNLLAITPTTEYSVTSITSNGNRRAGHKIEVLAGSKLEADVTLIRGTATVQGFARRAGNGVAGAMIVLVPSDPERDNDRFRRDQTDSDGSFSLANVIPGEYTIVAIDDGWDLNWLEPGLLAHYLPQGQRATVADGALRLPNDVMVQPK